MIKEGRSGVTTPVEQDEADYKISSFSGGGNCVEVARLPNGRFAVRDSKDPSGSVRLVFGLAEWTAFVSGVKAGEFDA